MMAVGAPQRATLLSWRRLLRDWARVRISPADGGLRTVPRGTWVEWTGTGQRGCGQRVRRSVERQLYDARVHVIYEGGTRHSLGTIASNARGPTTPVPWLPRPLFIEVTLVVGGGVYRSQAIDVVQGEVLQIRVPADLETSGFFRRVRR